MTAKEGEKVGSGLTLVANSMANGVILSSDVSFGIEGYFSYKLFGHTVWLTTTHISTIIIALIMIAFAIVANIAIRKADLNQVPGKFLNLIELIVTLLDDMTLTSMGKKHGYKFANYIGTLFIFILLSNLSGLIGLRSPTADYGVTFGLALITFVLIHVNGFKYQKFGHITNLFKPVLLAPINIIGELATPLSLSLRLFGNILSGTVMLALIYGLVPKLVLTLISPVLAGAHVYFDIFSGAIQTYVFCMLTMTFIAQNFDEDVA